jgi:energy-coupling factor transporter ATP-binding protein EcfA2
MQQRLAIAQALLKRPKILLLDEPFGALDPGIRADMQELLIELWKELGMTIFMVTHDIHEAFKLGTRVLVFDKIRHDPDAPERWGATITYDLPLDRAGVPNHPRCRGPFRYQENNKRRRSPCVTSIPSGPERASRKAGLVEPSRAALPPPGFRQAEHARLEGGRKGRHPALRRLAKGAPGRCAWG